MANKDSIIIKTELQIAQAKTNIKELRKEIAGLDMRYTESKLKVAKLANEELKLAQGKRRLIQRNKELTLSQNSLSGATGASTSAALEFGRVISDAPYGIRGVANNLSQLASQFSFMTNKVDATTGKVVGFKGALKDLGKSLKANAVLIAIQAVIAVMDYLSATTNKVSTALSKLGESGASEAITELTLLKNAIEDTSISLEKKEGLIKKAREEYEELNDALGDTPVNIANTLTALDLLIAKYKDVAKAKVLVELITEELKNQSKAAATTTGSWTDMFNSIDTFILGASSLSKGQGVQLGVAQGLQVELSKSEELIKKYEDMLNQKTKHDSSLTYLDLIYGNTNNKKSKNKSEVKSPLFNTKEELDLAVKDQQSALLSLGKKIEIQNLKNKENEELLNAKTEAEKNKIKRKYAEQQLELNISYEKKKLVMSKSTERQVAKIKHDEHIETLKRTLAEYEQKVKLNNKLSDSQKEDLIGKAKIETDKLIAQAGSELIKTNEGIDDAYAPVFKLFEELSKARRDALGIFSEDDDSQKDFDKLSFYIQQYKTVMSGVTDFVNGEFSRRLTIEENHTNALNEQLNNRLINENLSASEREKIQNQIAVNDEALRKKQNEIKRKQFNTQKAFNIASAATETYLAATRVLADPFFTGRPWERAIAMTATIGAGLAQVMAISRQKFQPDAASTPIATTGGGGSGSGGVGNRSFDFNLVGNNQNNQLADVIGSQFSQPLKAYVVSKDITNAQQLDANTKSAARFGD